MYLEMVEHDIRIVFNLDNVLAFSILQHPPPNFAFAFREVQDRREEERVTEHKTISIRRHQGPRNDHEGHQPHLLLPAVSTHVMIALTAVDDVRAPGLRRDVVRTGFAFMAEPYCWSSDWSLPITSTCWRTIT